MTPTKRRSAVADIMTVLDLVPQSKISDLLAAIEDCSLPPSGVGKAAGISGAASDGVTFLLEDGAISRESIALAVDAAANAKAKESNNKEVVEMSWTGPVQFTGGDRRHAGVLEDMIDSAVTSVTVVGYSITGGANDVIRLLERAAERGVTVTLVIHDDGSSSNLDALRSAWHSNDGPRLFTRDANKEDGYYKIHAKMVVVDSSDMLVTSANLTWHGMIRNFEIGLRIRGATARKGQALIDDLIAHKYLEEVSW